METNILFETVIGSHVWKMNTESSDMDIFQCYLQDTKAFLLKKQADNIFKNAYRLEGLPRDGLADIQQSELQTVVEQVIKNNYNYLLAVQSPIVNKGGQQLNELKEYSKKLLSRKAYDSIHGLAMQNYKKYLENNKDATQERLDKIGRVLHFGIILLNERKFIFNPVSGTTKEMIIKLMAELDSAKQHSDLPEEPEIKEVEEIKDWLINIRLEQIEKWI